MFGLFNRSRITNEHQEMIKEALDKLDKLDKIDEIDRNVKEIKAAQEEQGRAIENIDKRLSNIEKLLETNFETVITQVELLADKLTRISNAIRLYGATVDLLPGINRLLKDIHKQINLLPPSQIDLEKASDTQKAYVYMMSQIEKAIKDSREMLDRSIAINRQKVIEGVNSKSLDYANQLVANLDSVQVNLMSVIYETAKQNKSRNIDYEQIKQIIRNETRPAGSRNSYL